MVERSDDSAGFDRRVITLDVDITRGVAPADDIARAAGHPVIEVDGDIARHTVDTSDVVGRRNFDRFLDAGGRHIDAVADLVGRVEDRVSG